MTDPRKLRVGDRAWFKRAGFRYTREGLFGRGRIGEYAGDRVRFVSLPAEWSEPGYRVPRSSTAFMRLLIARRRPCRIARIDSYGYPWIEARRRRKDGLVEYHSWGIYEQTGWKRV